MAMKNNMRDGEDRFYDNDMDDIVELSPEKMRSIRMGGTFEGDEPLPGAPGSDTDMYGNKKLNPPKKKKRKTKNPAAKKSPVKVDNVNKPAIGLAGRMNGM